jgi:hypothetical protein
MVAIETVRLQLKCGALEHREVELADSSRASYPYVSAIFVRFKNRAHGRRQPRQPERRDGHLRAPA